MLTSGKALRYARHGSRRPKQNSSATCARGTAAAAAKARTSNSSPRPTRRMSLQYRGTVS